MVKLVLTDLDGTFVGSNHKVHPDNVKLVKKLKANGIKFGIATGRPFPGALALVEELDLLDYVDYFITTNGLEFWDVRNNIKLSQGMLQIGQIREAMEATMEFDTEYLVVEDGKIRTTAITEFTSLEGSINKLETFVKTFDKDMNDQYPKMICAAHEDIIKDIDKKMAKGKYSFECMISHKNFFEIMNAGVSKGSMVRYICETTGIDKSETIGLGDNNNDETLIKETGIGIAVKNATDFIKGIADVISDFNANDGAFSKELNKLIEW